MKTLLPAGFRCPRFVAAAAAVLCATVSFGAIPRHQVVAVVAHRDSDYNRVLASDGRPKVERYSFIQGDRLDSTTGGTVDLPFMHVAQVVSASLAEQNYLPARSGREADLLIVLNWGTTTGTDGGRYLNDLAYLARAISEGTAMTGNLDSELTLNELVNAQRDRINWFNAGILGYRSELDLAGFIKPYAPAIAYDIISDVEENRYFVVLKAYDFQLALHQKKFRERWETRFSIREFGNDFAAQLPSMAKYASQFYGQDTKRLLRRELPNVRVELGAPRIITTPQ